jgi:hypothetical protein
MKLVATEKMLTTLGAGVHKKWAGVLTMWNFARVGGSSRSMSRSMCSGKTTILQT